MYFLTEDLPAEFLDGDNKRNVEQRFLPITQPREVHNGTLVARRKSQRQVPKKRLDIIPFKRDFRLRIVRAPVKSGPRTCELLVEIDDGLAITQY